MARPDNPRPKAASGASDAVPNVAPHSLARNALHLVLGQVATTAIAIVLNGAIGRALGPSDFGVWYLISSVTMFGYVFVDWGYRPYLIREIARHPSRTGELTATVLGVQAASVLILCGPAMLATWLLGYDVRIRVLTAAMLAAWLPVFLAQSCATPFRAHERMDFDALVSVVLKAATLVLSLICLELGGRLGSLIVATGCGGLIAMGAAGALYKRLRLPALRPRLDGVRELVRGATPMFTAMLAVQAQPYIDVNVLSKLVPRAAVGWYGAAATFAGTLMMPAVILGGVAFPRLARAANHPAQFTEIACDVLRPLLFVAGLASLGTYLFADVAVSLAYAGSKFTPSGAIVRAFAPALFLVSVDILLGNIIMAAGRAKQFAVAKLAALVLTTALDFVLISVCQHAYGNGGIGVMLSFTAGEFAMVAAALHLVPAGTFHRRAALDVGRALLAAAVGAAVVRFTGVTNPFVAVPVSIAAYGGSAIGLGLVRRTDLGLLTTIVARRNGQGAAARPAA